MGVFRRASRPAPAGLVGPLTLTVAALCLAEALPSYALDAAQPQSATLDEITVTARRRSETLQSVPVAVSVFDGEQALRENRNDIQDLAQTLPTVDFRSNSSNKDRTIFIRGIGTISTSPGVEPSVSTVLDGVVLARPGEATADILELSRVEILRGPQGTLFGKNASAGVVNIVTKDPTSTLAAHIDLAYLGAGDEYRAEAGISGPLAGDRLTGLLAILGSSYGGNVKNAFTGDELNGYSHEGIRGKLKFAATDDLTLLAGIDYLHSEDTVPNGVFQSASRTSYPLGVTTTNANLATLLGVEGITPSDRNETASNDTKSRTKDDNGGLFLQADWRLPWATVTSITGYRRWTNTQYQDYDQLSTLTTSFPDVRDRGDLNFNQVSEELRLASAKGGLIDYVAGLYYLHADDDETYRRAVTRLSASGITNDLGVAGYGTVGNNYSAFGEADINIAPDFRAILGVRVVRDELDYRFSRSSTSAVAITGVRPNFASSGATSATDYADRLGLQYDFADQSTAYFTYSRGYKGPAFNVFFNMQATDTKALKPETSDAFEIGVKSRGFGGKLEIDLAAFLAQFDNYQANFTDTVAGAIVTRLINAGAVSSRGFEGHVAVKPTSALKIDAAFAYTLARVDNFACPPAAPVSCNINGEPLPFAPRWHTDVRADYLVPVTTQYDLDLSADFDWRSKTQFSLAETPDTIQGAYGILDASASLIDGENDWSVAVLGKNLTDRSYSSFVAYGSLAGVVRFVPRDAGRYFGVSLHKGF